MSSITRRDFMGLTGKAGIAAAAGGILGLTATGCSTSTASTSYKAGTYYAAAEGMAGYVNVGVSFDKKSITDIQIEDENQTVGICEEVYKTIPAKIIGAQSLDVDVVSGATMTSKAVINAVTQCVTLAGGDVEAMRRVKVPAESKDEEFTYDVVVIGAGLAGLCTAAKAAQDGSRVAIVEKQGVFGTAVFSSGITYISKEASGVDEMYKKWMTAAVTTSEYPTKERVRDLCESSPEVMQFLSGMGFKFAMGLNGNLMPLASMGMLRNNIPIRLGSVQPLAKGGEALMRSLEAGCKASGVDIYMNTGVTDFITKGNAIAGVICKTDHGTKTLNASAVVMCSGDYSRNREMVAKYCPESIHDVTSSAASNTGTCMELAVQAGAAPYESQEPMSGSLCFEPNNMPLCGQPFDQFPYSCMLVDYNGKRKVREDAPNNHVQHQYFRDTERPCAGWAIMNTTIARNVWVMDELLENTEKGYRNVKAYKADTIEELAQLIGVDSDVLSAQLAEYNASCDAGSDSFGKDAQYLIKMDQGPYYAALAYSIIRAIAGGVKTNRNFEVIREDGSSIQGLYATGVASSREYWGDYYPGAMAIALCTHGGYMAGRNAAQFARS